MRRAYVKVLQSEDPCPAIGIVLSFRRRIPMSTVRSLINCATEPECGCLWKNKVTGWIADFNALYDKVKHIDFGIDQEQPTKRMRKHLDEADFALKQVDNLVNTASFLEALDTCFSPKFPLLKRHANALKLAIEEMTSETGRWSGDVLGRLLELSHIVTSMSNGRPNIDEMVCDHSGFLRGIDEAPETLEEAESYPYRTQGKVVGICPTCGLGTKARIKKRSIDQSFFEKDPRCVRIRVWNGARRQGGDDVYNERYVQASFFRSDRIFNQGTQWTYTVDYSLEGGDTGAVGPAADVEKWSRTYGVLPKPLGLTFKNEVQRHHDTLVKTGPETESRLSTALRPELSPHEVFVETCGPMLALSDLLERLS